MGLLVALTFAAYAPAVRGGFLWDDKVYVSSNATLRTADGLRQIWLAPNSTPQYYPLVFTTFWLEYHLWGLDTTGYHLTNVVLHTCNALLLWLVLRRLRLAGALLAAAIFALHPVHVESVAWISERKDVLAGAFTLLTVLAWLRLDAAPSARAWLAVVLAFAAAMLSKTSVCALPLVCVLLSWWKDPATWRRAAVRAGPLMLIGVGLGLVTVYRERAGMDPNLTTHHLTAIERALRAARALWFYVAKLLWPANLMTFYPMWQVDSGAGRDYLFLGMFLAVLAALWLARRRLGRGPLVAALVFGLSLAPSLGFVDVNFMTMSYVADHFQYLPSIALIALFAAAMTNASVPWSRRVSNVLGAAMLVALAACTWERAHVYRDAETLWRDSLAKNPEAWMAHSNLAAILVGRRQFDEAIDHLSETIRLQPGFAGARLNLGTTLIRQGKQAEGMRELESAIRIKPDFALAHYDLGNMLLNQGAVDEAVAHLTTAVQLEPSDADARIYLGEALSQQGRVAEAGEQFTTAVKILPDYAEARFRLGRFLLHIDRREDGIDQLRIAVQLDPKHSAAQRTLQAALADTDATR